MHEAGNLEVIDWSDDLVRTATMCKIGVFAGSRVSVASPSLLKVKDPEFPSESWSSTWDSHRTTIDGYMEIPEPTFLPEFGDGTYYYNTECSQMEPSYDALPEEQVSKQYRFYRRFDDNIRVPSGVHIPPRQVSELPLTQRRAYRDIALLQAEGLVQRRLYLNAEYLPGSMSAPSSIVETSTASYIRHLLEHHPFPDEVVKEHEKRWSWPVCYEGPDRIAWGGDRQNDDERRALRIKGLCATAAARCVSTILPQLELRTSDEILELRLELKDSLSAFDGRVATLVNRTVEMSFDEPVKSDALSRVGWELERDYEDLKRAAQGSRFWALTKDSVPTFASVAAGLSLTLSTGIATGGSPFALGASAAAVPVAQTARLTVEWLRKSKKISHDPLFWRYRLSKPSSP